MPTSKDLPARYRFDLQQLIIGTLPVVLRKPRLIAWCTVLASPAAWLYEKWAGLYFTTKTELSYNGQTLQLERALNDRFDPAFRRIRIINADTFLQPTYLNFTAEQQPPVYAYLQAEGQPPLYFEYWASYVNQVGFTVQLPRNLRPQEAAVQARIKQLKLALIKHKLLYV